MRLLKVHEVARQLGCSETWLRRSEQRGRIPKARRDMNGWRVYTEADVAALRQILFPAKLDQLESQNGPDSTDP